RLPDLREEIAQCERQGKMYDACMVHYVDLMPQSKARLPLATVQDHEGAGQLDPRTVTNSKSVRRLSFQLKHETAASPGQVRPDVRFTPESRHVRCTSPCLLWAISRHRGDLFDHLVGAGEQ